MKQKPRIKVSLYLARRQIRLLRKLSRRTDLTFSELVRRAIDKFLKEQEA